MVKMKKKRAVGIAIKPRLFEESAEICVYTMD